MPKGKSLILCVAVLILCILTTLLHYFFDKYDYTSDDLRYIVLCTIILLQFIGADYYANYELGNLYIPNFEKTYKILEELEYIKCWDKHTITTSLERYRNKVHNNKLSYLFGITLGSILWAVLLGSVIIESRAAIIMVLIILAICLSINASARFPSASVYLVFPAEDYERYLPSPEKYNQMSLREQIKSKHDALDKLEREYTNIIESKFDNYSIQNTGVHSAITILASAVADPVIMFLFIFYAFKLNCKYTIIFTGIVYSILNIIFFII